MPVERLQNDRIVILGLITLSDALVESENHTIPKKLIDWMSLDTSAAVLSEVIKAAIQRYYVNIDEPEIRQPLLDSVTHVIEREKRSEDSSAEYKRIFGQGLADICQDSEHDLTEWYNDDRLIALSDQMRLFIATFAVQPLSAERRQPPLPPQRYNS